MRTHYLHILAAPALLLLAAGSLRAAEPAPASAATVETAQSKPQETAAEDYSDPLREFAARVGYWGASTSGSRSKVGEYQSLDPSPFWDADGLSSDGRRTADFSITGTDDETTDGRLHFYSGPGLSADIDYERFPHELHTKSYAGFANTPANATSSNFYSHTNNNPGQDYAIRVQDLKANFKGNLTDDGTVRWRVDVFGIYKEGERQANALTHCYDATIPHPPLINTSNATVTRQCHVLTQAQHIDWQTTEVEPGIEFRLGDLTVEYSHMIRTFEQNDQNVMNVYRDTPYSSNSLGFPGGTAGYAFVPDSETQIDRVKARADVGYDTDVYAFGFGGYTKNEFRDTHRRFGGADLRVTNNSFQNLTLTAYGKTYTETTDAPTVPLNTLYPSLASVYQENDLNSISAPINRDDGAVGLNGRWRPFLDDADTLRSKLALTGGYEYSRLRRTYAEDTIAATGGVFVQPNSNVNTLSVGVEEKWSSTLSSYIRYKYIDTEYPLYGISPDVNSSLDDALNSALPRLENRVEIGGTWNPTEQFMLTATLFAENALNHGPYVNFDSTSYPFMFTGWYAVNSQWSLSGGYANFANRINQDITLTSAVSGTPPPDTTLPWRYKANADVVNVGSRYAYTPKLTFTGDFEYVRGLNVITSTPAPTGAAVPFDLGQYSLVSVNTYRVSAGVDYLWRPRVTTYFRYNYYNFGDLATGLQTGEAHMFLGGVSATF